MGTGEQNNMPVDLCVGSYGERQHSKSPRSNARFKIQIAVPKVANRGDLLLIDRAVCRCEAFGAGCAGSCRFCQQP